MISHLSLQTKKALSKSVSLQNDENNFEFIVIKHDSFDAAFSLHGAHLLHFQLKNQAPIIWLSKTAIFNESKAIRGGVPVCWPWFGPAGKSLGDNLPGHGFARTSKWTVKNINELDNGVEIEFLLTDSEATRKLWPHQFELVLKATLTDTVKLALISTNTGTDSFFYRTALHTYLAISSPEACKITGLNKHYADMLNAGEAKEGNGNLTITEPVDTIYQKAESAIMIDDSGYNRKLTVTNTGNDSEVVWNPWISGAKAFADMPDDGYQTMLCVESAITDQAGETVAAGQSHTLTTTIA
jgi:glucose-6-phosphate 1-epimerase